MKRINLSIIILGIIEAICYFMPNCLLWERWEYRGAGLSVLESKTDINIFGVRALSGKILAYFLLCMAVLKIVVFLLKALDIKTLAYNGEWNVSITHTVAMLLFVIYVYFFPSFDNIGHENRYELSWLFFVIIAINVISLVLAIVMKYWNGSVFVTKHNNNISDDRKESLDDLIAYKELLDSGALTQEEFDKKKKQLLDL